MATSTLCPRNCGCGNAVHEMYTCTGCGGYFDGGRDSGHYHIVDKTDSNKDELLCPACEAKWRTAGLWGLER
jgi:hypothetical protein